MQKILTIVFAVSVATLPESASTQDLPPDLAQRPGIPLGLPPETSVSSPAGKGVFSAFQNGSFEETDGGEPVGWAKNRFPELRTEGENNYVRVADFFRYGQSVALPLRHRAYTVSGRYRSDTINFPAIAHVYDDGRESVFQSTSTFLDAGDWTRIYVTHPVQDAIGPLQILPSTVFQLFWTDLDDVAVFDEGMTNGGFDLSPASDGFPLWDLQDGASITDEALNLPSGASATTMSGAIPLGQSYFIAFRSDTPGVTTSLTLSVENIDVVGSTVGELQETTLPLPAGFAFHVVETGEVDSGVQAARAALANDGENGVRIDDVSRGFVHVWPRDYDPSPESLNPDLILTAAWPRQVAAASVTIRNSLKGVVETIPMTVGDGTATASWNGAGQGAGTYTAEFELESTTGDTVFLGRSFELRNDLAAPSDPPAYASEVFQRGAWIWLLDLGPDEEDIRPFFELAKADGFNFATVFAFQNQWSIVREVCEDIEMPFIAGNDLMQGIVRSRPPNISPLAMTAFHDEILAELGDLVGSPMLMGLYPTDEPDAFWQFDNAAAAVRAIAASSEFGPSFITISPPVLDLDPFPAIRPAAHWTDFYPFVGRGIDLTLELKELSDHIVDQVALANSLGREYWLVPQAWSFFDGVHTGNSAAIRATIGLCIAHGAKGYVPFPYRQINPLEGIRTKELGPLPETGVWISENHRIQEIETELIAFNGHGELANVDGPLVVTTAEAPGDETIVVVVSLECRRRTRVALEISGGSAALEELTGKETPRDGAGVHEFEFEPGGWRIWRLVDGAVVSALSATVSDLPPTLDLPVTADVTIGEIRHLDFRPFGSQVIASCGSRIYRVGTTGTVFDDIAVENVVSSRWISVVDAYLFSPTNGITSVRFQASPVITGRFQRETAAATFGFVDGNRLWSTADFLGVREYEIQDIGLAEGDYESSVPTDLREPAGILADGRVLLPTQLSGVLAGNVDNSGDIILEPFNDVSVIAEAALSPDRDRLAMARMRRGFAVQSIDNSGNVNAELSIPHRGEYVAAVAWITNDLLAVGEIDGDVEFFGVGDDSALTLRGRWRPEPRPAQGMSAMVSANNILAVGFRDGRLLFVDVSQLPEEFDDGTEYWLLN